MKVVRWLLFLSLTLLLSTPLTRAQTTQRKGAALVFNETVLREVRRGDRMMPLAEIEGSDIPGGRMTIVATHLEDKVKPEGRYATRGVPVEIKNIPHPVVVADDMNNGRGGC